MVAKQSKTLGRLWLWLVQVLALSDQVRSITRCPKRFSARSWRGYTRTISSIPLIPRRLKEYPIRFHSLVETMQAAPTLSSRLGSNRHSRGHAQSSSKPATFRDPTRKRCGSRASMERCFQLSSQSPLSLQLLYYPKVLPSLMGMASLHLRLAPD